MRKLRKAFVVLMALLLLTGTFSSATFATEENNTQTYEDNVTELEAEEENPADEETMDIIAEDEDFVHDSSQDIDNDLNEEESKYDEKNIDQGLEDASDISIINDEEASDKNEIINENIIETEAAIDSSVSEENNSEEIIGKNVKKAPATSKEDVKENIDKTAEIIKISNIKLNLSKAEMATNGTLQLNATVEPKNTTEKIIWKSANEDIATVDQEGKVTAKKYGKVAITAQSESGEKRYVCEIQTRFYDVNDKSKYYFEPVYWAADKEITQGYDNLYFGPQRNCTRREMVIFLWRYSGKPQASSKVNFKDVKYGKNTDSYKAIQWGVEKGIIKGYSDNTFKPNNSVIRKDAMIMLYRFAGKPKTSGYSKFSDTTTKKYSAKSDSYKSIIWGTTVGITNGYSNGTFKPDANCLREHIVTFLYRYKDNKSKSAYLQTPSPLKAEISGKSLKVSWKAVKGADSYEVQRWIYSKKKYEKVATTKSTSWSFKGVKSGDVHKFKVVAKSGKLSSDFTEVVTGVYLSTPALKSASVTKYGIEFKWNSVSGATGYKVYRKTEKSDWAQIASTKETTFKDLKASNATKYIYTVRAYKDVSGKSYLSDFDKTGKSAKINDDARGLAEKRLKACGNTLRKAYNWTVKIKYKDQPGSSTTSGYAKWTFNNSMGDCLGKAAAFCYMARLLGYEAELIYGSVPLARGGYGPHGWVEIKDNGTWYVCDPDFETETGRNGYFIQYGQSGTWRYNKQKAID